ncbi:transposase family protein [Vagococcus sp. AM17-17]|nr:transposase family protein [Vagococcus sp. AM17-17]
MSSLIKWISVAHYPTYLLLNKQRILCRECHTSFLAESLENDKHLPRIKILSGTLFLTDC